VSHRNTAVQQFEKENSHDAVQAEDDSDCERDIDRILVGAVLPGEREE